MPIHRALELNLLENSFDYLSASLEYIIKARRENSYVSWKFAILNLTFAIELLLKERLRRANEILIYSDLNKFLQIDRETKTVSWPVLIVRLKYILGRDFEKVDGGRLALAQKLRNQMLHYDVQLYFPDAYHHFTNLLNFYTTFFNTEISEGEEDTLHKYIRDELWRENVDLSEAFYHDIVFYNGIFMGQDLQDAIINEQEKPTLLIEGKIFRRIPHMQYLDNNLTIPPDQSEFICHDCGVYPGQLHLLGCDMETCPNCLKQLFSCGCEYQYPE